ncbi:aminoglycoside adenylyltransferase domain-containing protein [Methylobacterium symbioticum]|uniref:Aminoglycoside (3'') (9) adenylyltransferase n=1 Tax=Methylobacterium symbioticum TaxID=2584084 RepID=A0A509EIC2_9HYPH|nr:aminoglycoside adenylyltransferase domain-containing protein [Methylobacterium symbioticum]VUD73135.1 hypothetical protein MET9862_03749 [Methylobacterium symbioticum]
MSLAVPLPAAVETVIMDVRRRLTAQSMPSVKGLYLVGSVALDDFRPGMSDIDFVAVLDREPTAEECAALERLHIGLAEVGGPNFDGVYLTANALKRVPTAYAPWPFSLQGRLRTGEICREVNPAVWRCLARHGRTVSGPPPAALGIADDGDALRAYQIGNLQGYWLTWIEQAEAALAAKAAGEDANAESLAWGVLGVARIACALETDGVVSKSGGGRHALAAHPARWHTVIREALAAHAGATQRVPIALVQEGVEYMRFAITAATARAQRR